MEWTRTGCDPHPLLPGHPLCGGQEVDKTDLGKQGKGGGDPAVFLAVLL